MSLVLAALPACGSADDGVDEQAEALHARPLPLALAGGKFTTFETGQVRPLALSPDGRLLFALNTPDNRLEVFRTGGRSKLKHVGSVVVGLEPIAVAARSNDEVWVVNHLSDSVSIVDVSDASDPRVVRTLLVGDEPRDIVFAGTQRDRAFITTAHRGQNSPVDPQFTTPGVGRADVFVFDARNLGTGLGGTPLSVLTLFADTPRALTTSADGRTVYAAAFASGNQTTVVAKGSIDTVGLPPPTTITIPTPQGPRVIPQPGVGLIVKFVNGHWVDRIGRVLDQFVKFNLPDKDVFAIDATATPPVQTGIWTGVGTTLFSMATNPKSGKIYVANTDARNDVRFEGHGNVLPPEERTVRGNIATTRVTVLDGASVLPRNLNKHINFSVEFTPGERERSLSTPQALAVTKDGKTLFVAAFGSSKVGVFNTAELEADTFVPSAAAHVTVSGGGPAGIVLSPHSDTAYVLTRFDNGISVIDASDRQEVAHVSMFNPEPAHVVLGRPFLYDAVLTSSHGDASCSSCHIAGDMDQLAWDLGDPDAFPLPIPNIFVVGPDLVLPILPFVAPVFAAFQPLKGPMTTQSLRGMANHGAMHWRGDRNGGFVPPGVVVPSSQPDNGAFSEQAAFKAFNVAFPGLLGREAPLTAEQMQAFTDFILEVTYPPNPVRNLDNSLTAQQQAGRAFYFNNFNGQQLPSDRFFNCNGCHTLDPQANAAFGVSAPGFFGTDGRFSFENETQIFKVPHLRNQYQKVGMFGMSPEPLVPETLIPQVNVHMGDQIRGFGFQHDGAIDNIRRFVSQSVFIQVLTPTPSPGGPGFPDVPPNPFGIPPGPEGEPLKRSLEAFMLAFDSNLAPIVGQQVTLDRRNGAVVGPRITLLEERATAGECDLVVRGRLLGREVGFLYTGGRFMSDRSRVPSISDGQIRALGHVTPLTFTCTPPGSGVRVALDRDGDTFADGDELAWGSDPADASSRP